MAAATVSLTDVGTSSNEFQDTSEFIYRNSSEKAAGFTFEAGTVNEDRSINEDIVVTTEALDAACRTDIKDMITTLKVDAQNHVDDRDHLITRAHAAWDRAIALYTDFETQLTAETDDIKTEFTDRICAAELEWQRTAGSSLNTLVQDMKARSEAELARRLAGVISTRLQGFRNDETNAIANAFQHEFIAHHQTAQISLSQLIGLGNLLKGSIATQTTDRDLSEDVDQIRAMGNYFRNAKTISDDQGTHSGEVDSVATAVSAIAAF